MTDTNIGLERSGHVVIGVDTHKQALRKREGSW